MKRNIKDALEVRKCALYIRVSTHYQVDKDSLPLQREDLINYSKYALDIDNYEVFEDAGYSGKNTERPAYQQMMSRLRSGEFSHLVVWKIDRISRNLLDFANMYAEIKKLGVVFVSKNEQFDTSSAMGEAMLKIILVFAELERNMTSERVTAVMLSRASNGQWNGGRIPFGYNYDKETKRFTINEKEASIIRLIYDLYESSRSLIYVSQTLNEKGLFPRSGHSWSPTTVHAILRNPFVTGDYRYNKHDTKVTGNSSTKYLKKDSEVILVEQHHPSIIEPERQSRIVSMMTKNSRGWSSQGKTYSRKNTNIFAGLIQCGLCGSFMQSTTYRERDGYTPSAYGCSRRRRFKDCDNTFVSDLSLGPFVLNYILNVIRAQNNFGKSTSIEAFEKKLLRGELFRNIEGIERSGLKEMYDMLKLGKYENILYSSKIVEAAENAPSSSSERDSLISEKRKKERALARLKSLYLYDDEAITEVEYIVEKKSLVDSIEAIDQRLEEIELNSSENFSLSDEEFIAKASFFIMSNQLQEKRFINYQSLVRQVDQQIIKEFVNSVIKKIVTERGKITLICFKNGIEHKFSYKE